MFAKDYSEYLQALTEPDRVQSFDIGADCMRQIGVERALEDLSRFKNLATLTISDDYLSDGEKHRIEKALSRTFPSIQFNWSYELKVDGRHGR